MKTEKKNHIYLSTKERNVIVAFLINLKKQMMVFDMYNKIKLFL